TALRAVGAAHHTRLTVLAAFGPNGEPPAVPGCCAVFHHTVTAAAVRVRSADVVQLNAVRDLLRTMPVLAQRRAAVRVRLTRVARRLAAGSRPVDVAADTAFADSAATGDSVVCAFVAVVETGSIAAAAVVAVERAAIGVRCTVGAFAAALDDVSAAGVVRVADLRATVARRLARVTIAAAHGTDGTLTRAAGHAAIAADAARSARSARSARTGSSCRRARGGAAQATIRTPAVGAVRSTSAGAAAARVAAAVRRSAATIVAKVSVPSGAAASLHEREARDESANDQRNSSDAHEGSRGYVE